MAQLIETSSSDRSAPHSWIPRLRARGPAVHAPHRCSLLPSGALRLIQTAVTRRCVVDNSVVGPNQAIAVKEAIRAVTAQAAAQIGQAERIGTLGAGKEADLVALEQDPFKVAPDEIMNIKVSQTWVSGEKIFG